MSTQWSQRGSHGPARELTDEAGYPPSIREIADALARSASGVAYHLPAMEQPWESHPRHATPRPAPAVAPCGSKPTVFTGHICGGH
ncbi:LexA family protein [Streptomyces sioyaensis]|uniref:LexA family protein n=1 Tax=Streptomyces sioyaensis TaxID=67364 RepID=UPI00378B5475